MSRDASHQAGVLHGLDVIVHALAVPFGEQPVRRTAVMNERDRLAQFDRRLDLVALRVQQNILQFRALLAQNSQTLGSSFDRGKLMRIDPRSLALLKELDASLGGEVLLHVPIGVCA